MFENRCQSTNCNELNVIQATGARMAINSTLHFDGNCDALHQSMPPEATARQPGMKRIQTKANFVRIVDQPCEDHLGPEHEDVNRIREKLQRLVGENERLRTQLIAVNLREAATNERVKEAELHMQGLRKQFEEKLIAELQKDALESSQKALAKPEVDGLQVVCQRDNEKRELQELVDKMQLLCVSHKTSAYADANIDVMGRMEDHQGRSDLFRSNGAYEALPPTEETKLLCWNNNQRVEYDADAEQVAELQEEVKMLSTKLKFSVTQRQAMKEAITAFEAKLTEVAAENWTLKKELYIERRLMKAREDDVHNLETRVQALSTSNHMLTAMLNVKEMALETKKLLDFTPLEPTLLQLAAIVSAQNACVVRLSSQNEELARSLRFRIQEHESQHDQIATAVTQKDAAVRALEHFKQQMVEWATEMDERNSNCEVLQEYVLNMEAELRHCHSQIGAMLETYEEVRQERDQLAAWQAHARTRFAEYENAIDEREKEAESISREALHMGLEVELLRRKLQQLDEDVMLKEGQISILRSSWDGEE